MVSKKIKIGKQIVRVKDGIASSNVV